MRADGIGIIYTSNRTADIRRSADRISVLKDGALTHTAASKGALLALHRTVSVELAPHAIQVNAVAPGMTHTLLFHARLETRDNAAESREQSRL